MSEAGKGFPFAFACRRSGNCCAIPGGFVRASAEELARIAAVLGLDELAFRRRFVQPDGHTLKEGLGHRCVFLQDGAAASCTIYEARPEQCRTWPFWERMKTDDGLLALARRVCPGISDPQQDAGP